MKLVAPDWIDLGVGRADLPLSPPPVPEVRTGTPRLPPLFETGKRWHVHGIDYCLFPSRLQAELDRLEERIDPEDGFANVLVLHQQSEAQVPVGDCELADRMIPDVFDLVVLGHHHRPESFSLLTRSGRSVSCLSPGGFHLKKINEEPRKQLYTLFADGSVDSDPLVTRRVITLDLNGGTQREILEKTERILASIRTAKVRRPPEIERPILSVEMNGETFSGAERLLEEIFGETVHLFVKRDGEEDDGINVGQYDDIDVERYTEIGVRYARHIFPNCEPDPEVREIVETMLTREASEANYLAMKETFLSRHKVVPGQAG